jgi:hypothetical protein
MSAYHDPRAKALLEKTGKFKCSKTECTMVTLENVLLHRNNNLSGMHLQMDKETDPSCTCAVCGARGVWKETASLEKGGVVGAKFFLCADCMKNNTSAISAGTALWIAVDRKVFP